MSFSIVPTDRFAVRGTFCHLCITTIFRSERHWVVGEEKHAGSGDLYNINICASCFQDYVYGYLVAYLYAHPHALAVPSSIASEWANNASALAHADSVDGDAAHEAEAAERMLRRMSDAADASTAAALQHQKLRSTKPDMFKKLQQMWKEL